MWWVVLGRDCEFRVWRWCAKRCQSVGESSLEEEKSEESEGYSWWIRPKFVVVGLKVVEFVVGREGKK